jgi:hypothetical protein
MLRLRSQLRGWIVPVSHSAAAVVKRVPVDVTVVYFHPPPSSSPSTALAQKQHMPGRVNTCFKMIQRFLRASL